MLAGDANADIMRIVIECIRERTMRGQSGDFEPQGLPDAKKSPVPALLWIFCSSANFTEVTEFA